MVRETRRFCPTIAGAAHQGGGAFEARSLLPSCGPDRSVLDKFTGALDAILPEPRQGWLEASAHAGASAANETPAAARIDRRFKKGSGRGGLFHADVDHLSCRRANPTAMGHRLSSGARVEDFDRLGLELPKTRTTGHSAQPQENPGVEAARLAAYKKKPGACARIWFSSMRAGSCSFRRCCAHGRPKAALRCCGTAIAGNGSRSLED